MNHKYFSKKDKCIYPGQGSLNAVSTRIKKSLDFAIQCVPMEILAFHMNNTKGLDLSLQKWAVSNNVPFTRIGQRTFDKLCYDGLNKEDGNVESIIAIIHLRDFGIKNVLTLTVGPDKNFKFFSIEKASE